MHPIVDGSMIGMLTCKWLHPQDFVTQAFNPSSQNAKRAVYILT